MLRLLDRIRPPEQAALRMDLVLIEGTNTPCGVACRRLHLDDVSAQISQDFATQETALVSEIKHAIWTQHALSRG